MECGMWIRDMAVWIRGGRVIKDEKALDNKGDTKRKDKENLDKEKKRMTELV